MKDHLPDATGKDPGAADRRGHEPDVIQARLVTVSIGGLVLLVAFSLLIVHFVNRGFSVSDSLSGHNQFNAAWGDGEIVPEVSADQPRQLRNLHNHEQRQLSSYEWVDKDAGLARIPIEQAMRILAERGFEAPRSASAPSAIHAVTTESTEARETISEPPASTELHTN